MPLDKPFDQINKDDLDALLAQGDAERKTLEYKRDLLVDQPSDRKEFLFDISSLANTLGGHILFGVEEDEGVPIDIPGLPGVNPDTLISTLENICRDGIEPRIPGLHMKAIPIPGKDPVIVIRLPRSWARPHMVKYRGTNKFYARNSNGKYPMDVSEIRSAFLLSDTAGERIREFRIDRVASIGADETPVALDPFPKIILQLIPSSFSDFQFQVDLGQAKKFYMKSFGTSGLRRFRYNFDGWLGYDGEPTAFSYVQLFRSGTVETVDASTLRESSIPSVYFEKELFNTVRDLLKFQADIGVEPPLFALLTLINVKGYSMAVRDVIRRTPTPIDRDHLFVPEVIIESFESKNELVVKALVDPVWRACGFLETPYFNGEQQRFLWPR